MLSLREIIKGAPNVLGNGEPPRAQPPSIFERIRKSASSDPESEMESETGSKSDKDLGKTTAAITKVNGQKLKQKVSSSTSGNGNDKDSENASEADESSTSSDGGSGSESDSNISSEREASKKADPTAAFESSGSFPMQNQSNPQSILPEIIAPYNPANGFREFSKLSDDQSNVSEIFKLENLAGKQIWYITAPESVPISSVKKISLQDVQLGKPALSINGQDYGFVQEQMENRNNIEFLVPVNRLYRTAKKSIDRTLHLQKTIQLPNLHNWKDSRGHRDTVPVKKQQPDGLRMRFCPIGLRQGKADTIVSTSPSYVSDSCESSEGDKPIDKKLFTSHRMHSAQKGHLPKPSAKDGPNSDNDMTSALEPIGGLKWSSSSGSTRISDSSSESSAEQGATQSTAKDFVKSKLVMKRKLGDLDGDSPNSSKVNGAKPKKTRLDEISEVKPKKLSPRKNDALRGTIPTPSTPLLSRPASNGSSTQRRPSTPILPPPRPGHTGKKGSFPVTSSTPGKEQQIATHTKMPQAKDELAPEIAEKASKTSQVQTEEKSKSRSNTTEGKSLEDLIKDIDPGLNEEQRRKEIRRLRRNEQSRVAYAKRKSALANATLSKATENSSIETVINSPPKPHIHKVLPQAREMETTTAQDTQPPTLAPKKEKSKKLTGEAVEQKGKTTMKDKIKVSRSSPREESVILPPRTRMPMPK